MDELHRITFRFAGHTEVRYLNDLPKVDEYVTHDGDLWLVTSVESDPLGPLVDCQLPRSEKAQLASER